MSTLLQKPEILLWLVPLLPLFGFLINSFFGRRMSLASSSAIACGSIVSSFVVAAVLFASSSLPRHTTLLRIRGHVD